MANKITTKAINSFLRGENFHLNNTCVLNDGTTTKLLLWGNCIAYYNNNEREIYFSLCGWNTKTTRERLNGLGLRIRTRAGVVYWGNHEIDAYKYHNSEMKAYNF